MDYDRFVKLRLGHLYNKDSCKNIEVLYDEVSCILQKYINENNIIINSQEEKKLKELFKLDIDGMNVEYIMSSTFNMVSLFGAIAGLVISTIDYNFIKNIYVILMLILSTIIIEGYTRIDINQYKKKVLSTCLTILENR